MKHIEPPPLRHGFTLIELLVVLAIVALLLTLAVPRYFGQVAASKESVLRENLRATRAVIDKFYGDTGRYPESLAELVDKQYLKALPVDPVTEANDTWAFVQPPTGYEGKIADLKSGAPGRTREGQAYGDL
jgi:general secretion pathway protein G